jgi:sulfate transport system permease protein
MSTVLPQAGAPRRHSILPGFGLSLGYALAYFGRIVLIPLAAVFARGLGDGWAAFADAALSPRALAARRLSFGTAFGAALINLVFGLLVAWVLVRYEFPGRRLLDALIDLPFALPTAVAGIALATLYAPNGWIGQWLAPYGIQLGFNPWGIGIALLFVGLPFVVRTLQPVLADLGHAPEEAAATLGAGRAYTFARVVFPALLPALLTGFALALARGIRIGLIAIAVGFLALALLLPLTAVFVEALREGAHAFIDAIAEPDALAALWLTLLVAAIAVPLNLVFGVAAAWVLELVRLPGLAARYPAQLSGGQQQRIALARALAIEPRLLLLDEPFGALDAQVRKELRQWLRELHAQTGLTTLFVTHDQDEALELADRIVVLRAGCVEQVGTPDQIFEEPANRFVHEFVGESCALGVRVDAARVWLGDAALEIDARGLADGPASLLLRPQHIRLVAAGPGTIGAEITAILRVGARHRVEARALASGERIEIEVDSRPTGDVGSRVHLHAVRGRVYRND